MKPALKNAILWIMAAAALTGAPLAAQTQVRGTKATSPTEVAAAYLDAMDAADLDRAESLFAEESSIFEAGGEEGTWKHYREHHIGPELAEFASAVQPSPTRPFT